MTEPSPKITRCRWATTELNIPYHDEEWGVPVHDDHRLFEMLTLEGAQAGLSWLTVLRKREGYRRVFDGFDGCDGFDGVVEWRRTAQVRLHPVRRRTADLRRQSSRHAGGDAGHRHRRAAAELLAA